MEELDKVKIKSLKINFTLKTNKLQEELKLSLILSVRERGKIMELLSKE